MNKLLDRLKQVDPTTYENIANCLAWAEVQWEELCPEYEGDKPYIPEDAEISTPMEYLIQGVLQDAISGKGWSLSQHQGLGKCGAVIRYHANFDPITGYGESPAKSLLAAYIAACEAMT